MIKRGSFAQRLSACALLSSTALFGVSANAQEVVVDLPLNEVCVSTPYYTCMQRVIGTRTITTIEPGVFTPQPDGSTILEGIAQVDFDGELQVSGYASTSIPEFIVPGYELEFLGEDIEVLASTSFVVDYSLLYLNPADPRYGASPLDLGTIFTVNALDTRQIAVDIDDGFFEFDDGGEGSFSLAAIDPFNIVNNSTELSGKFSSTDGRIVYGTLSGTASVVPADGPTTVMLYGTEPVEIASPLVLDFAVTSTVQTLLDETGLITPRVEVTDGIELNGSTISGLAAGVAPSDAVNVAQLDAEAAARVAGDFALAASIADEAALRAAGDTALAVSIADEAALRAAGDSALAASIADEATARASADTALAASIADEAALRAAGDATLAASITDEATARAAGDASLATAIGNEATARAAGDGTLAAAIGDESTARQDADAQIVAMLGQEMTVRADADTALSQRITANTASINAFAGATAAEAAARMAADTALSQRIDTLDDRLDVFETRLDRFDDRIASSAAVATAMGGAAFLPDMNFNLTANVATYDGAQAGSLQLGALLSPNVAVNAGVATGFNKGGKTAGRVGVTLGW